MGFEEMSKEALVELLQLYFTAKFYDQGHIFFELGDLDCSCYLLLDGIVALDKSSSSQRDPKNPALIYVERGNFFGEASVLGQAPSNITAYAETKVEVLQITLDDLKVLRDQMPNLAFELLRILAEEIAGKFEGIANRLDGMLVSRFDSSVERMLDDAEKAQESLMRLSEDAIDQVLCELAEAFALDAENLARIVVAETGIGNVADKTIKNLLASRAVFDDLRKQQIVGHREQLEKSILEVLHPIGILFASIPITNPTSTFIFKILVSIKSRNALIVSPNRRALASCERVGEIAQQVLVRLNLPSALLQWRGLQDRKRMLTMMRHPRIGLVLATGGTDLVKAAYSSGNPAIGVGSGNAPTLVWHDANYERAANAIVDSKSFDNGLICGAEHNLLIHDLIYWKFVKTLGLVGAAVLNSDEILRFRSSCFDKTGRAFSSKYIGQSAASIALDLGIVRSYPIRLIVVPLEKFQSTDPLVAEKLLPVLSLFSVRSERDAVELSKEILKVDGYGHTAIVHTENQALVERFAAAMPVSRILVNSPGAQGVFGISTDLPMSFILGCGTFGNSSTTDNVGVLNLVNRKRIAYLELKPEFQSFFTVRESVGV